jgi:putative component of membrane protein insertase Oxa1/YidC/SpoIIIJ protein YidD
MKVTSTNFAFSDWLSLYTGIRHRFRTTCSKYRNYTLAVSLTLTSILNEEGSW